MTMAVTLAGCSEGTDALQTPDTAAATANNGLISQKNFSMVFSELQPAFLDIETGLFTEVTSDVTIRIGDNNNQLITGPKTVFFQTEWGLIEPSCETDTDGSCTVTWRSGNTFDMPINYKNTITAYSSNGQESFLDLDGNGRYNDGDTFTDLDEPYVDNNESGVFDAGDKIIDTINGVDLTGTNALHDLPDGKYNGPNCSHSTDCSPVLSVSTVWTDGFMQVTGANLYTVGGTVSGLAGTMTIQNNGRDDLIVDANGSFTFATSGNPGDFYSVTISAQPATRTCTVTDNATGLIGRNQDGSILIGGNITNIVIVCI